MAGSRVRARAIVLLAVAAAAGVWASAGPAGAPIPKDAAPPWADPAHQGQLELLASHIASSLAGRPVAVHCEDPSTWTVLASQLGFDSGLELGYVPVAYDPTGQTVLDDPTLIELSPEVCLSLQQFASTDPKPTTCTVLVVKRETVLTKRRLLAREQVMVNGHPTVRLAWRVKLVPKTVRRRRRSAPRPCFAHGAPVAGMTNVFWSRYADEASAILVLAHETVHLTQYRAGAQVQPQAEVESEAQCLGMQWMPAVAVQLGDTPDDAEAIAQYTYAEIYPNFKGTPYWSAACVAGGSLDRRAPSHPAWP